MRPSEERDCSQGVVGGAVSHPDEVEVFAIASRRLSVEFVEACASDERHLIEVVRFGGAVQHRFKQQVLFDLVDSLPGVCHLPLMDRSLEGSHVRPHLVPLPHTPAAVVFDGRLAAVWAVLELHGPY